MYTYVHMYIYIYIPVGPLFVFRWLQRLTVHIHCLTAHPPSTGVVSYGELPKLDPWDSHSRQVSGMLKKKRTCWTASQICFLSAETAKALTMVLAGFALHLVSTPNAILIPALVAGLRRVLILQRPGMVKMPFFLTSVVARVAKSPLLGPHESHHGIWPASCLTSFV